MKAVRIHSFGGADVLEYEDVPSPAIGTDDLLLAVHASSINGIDRFVRAGYMQGTVDFPLPLTLGLDLSGIVAAVGADVADFAVGDEVYGYSNMMRQGAYAEYAVVGASEVAPKPAGVDHATAAAVPLAGLAAWQSLELLDLMAGQTILIQGAAGGVGTFAVQFAVQRGAHVIATAAADKHELLRELGVVEPINYGTIRFEEVVHGVDAVLDLVGGEVLARSLTVLKPGGMLVTTAGQPDVAAAAARGVRAQGIQTYADPAQLAEIGSLIVTGAVKPIISDVFPLAGARHAHELADRGHARGKIVLRMV